MPKECFCGIDIPEFMKPTVRSAVCRELEPIYEMSGENYCLLHLPSKSKTNEFEKVLDLRLAFQNYNFKGVFFPNEVDLAHSKIECEADFSYAIFSELTRFDYVNFSQEVRFNSTVFKGNTSFDNAKFTENVTFWLADFQGNGLFRNTKFCSEADFNEVVFDNGTEFDGVCTEKKSRLLFKQTTFNDFLSFQEAKIEGQIHFFGGKTSELIDDEIVDVFTTCFEEENFYLSFEHATIENPEKINFHSVRLRPSWFVNVDSRKFNFINVSWENSDYFAKANVVRELEHQKENSSEFTKEVFKVTCRQLAENAENNNRFEEASNFRRMAFETEWLEKKEKICNWVKRLVCENEKLKRRFGGSAKEEDKPILPTNSFGILRRSGDFFIHGLYRITSFYGESWSWALGVLLSLILVIFPIIYTQINFQTCSKDRLIAASLTVCESKDEEISKNCTCRTDRITLPDAIVQSLTTATLQNVEYRKPLTGWGELWIILEKIFSPLQAALSALAIRRKFMR